MIYTRNGDDGKTSLVGQNPVAKNDLRIEIIGQIDELSAVLGIVQAEGLEGLYAEIVLRVQKDLSFFCAEVAGAQNSCITEESVKHIEQEIDKLSKNLLPFTQFVVPGKNKPSAYLHLARTVCRRAERSLVQIQPLPPILASYLNRLSDLLFILAENVK